jgi:flagellar hook-length control protein FliK
MFFNPLFIDTNSAGLAQGQMNSKLGKSQYLFSDIIKISLSQSEIAESASAPAFNLSLIGNSGNVSSLFSNAAFTAKASVDSDTGIQNPEAALIQFLQYAFVSQNAQVTSGVSLNEIMKDKELILSKDSITNALTQLLQIYQPSVSQDSTSLTSNSTGSATVSSDKLASQILASLDDKGKVVLNFNNTASQIKIELTKLNNAEKELFISTKIIPMALAGAANKAESGKTETESSKGGAEVKTVHQQAAAGQTALTGLTAEECKSAQPAAEQSTVKETVANPKVIADASAGQNIQTKTECNSTENKETKINTSETSGETSVSNAGSSGSTNKTVIPVSTGLEEKAKETGQAAEDIKDVSSNKPAFNNTGTIKSAHEMKQETALPEVKTETENKNSEYKLRVVEITTDKSEKAQDAKIYSMNQFEKNLIKNNNITYTSAAVSDKKQAAPAAEGKQVVETPDDNITTVAQADEKILKTNNILFDGTIEAKQAEKSSGIVNTDAKAEAGRKVPAADLLKSSEGIKNEKTAGSKLNSTDIKPAKSDDVNNVVTAKDNTVEKKIKSDNTVPEQTKQVIEKTSKQTIAADDGKTKSVENKTASSETVEDSGKKSITESEKSSFKQNFSAEQKEANNQNGSEKKGSESKQANVQNVGDKEKIIISKNEVVKDTGKQPEVTKTVKTYEIIKEIKSFIEQGTKSSMTLNIEPENLGSVKISLDMTQNIVQARINVDNESVKQYVQTNLESLKQSLNQSGVNLGNIQVNVSSSDQKQQKNVSPFKRRMSGKTENISYDEVEETANKKILGYNSYDYLA